MPSDLRVSAITLPSPLRAPCPMRVVVTVTNDGDEPPEFTRQSAFLVAVDITASLDEPFRSHYVAKVLDPERSRIPPGGSIDVTVDVQFPCAATTWVRADADTTRAIANNLHSQPPFAVVANPVLVPSLFVTLKADHDHSQGHQPNDNGVCPDREVKVFVTVTNHGCARSPATTAVVTLEDPKGPVFATRTHALPPIDPGKSYYLYDNVTTPKLASVPGRVLVFRACADPNQLIVDQCDRATLCAVLVKSVETGSAPRITIVPSITPKEVIFPGQFPRLIWNLQNSCADIGAFTWRLLYGNPPTTIAQGSGVVFPREQVGAEVGPTPQARLSPITIPPAIANTFWAIGKQTVTVEILGTGKDPGPYRASYDIDVSPEKVDATWWAWSGVFFVPWNATYPRSAFLRNSSRGPMTLTALDFTEHPVNAPDQTTDAVTAFAASSLPPPIAPGTTALLSSNFFHTWTWMSRAFFVRTGQIDVVYEYTAHFTLTDAFGNAYGPITSDVFSTHVAVSSAKVAAQTEATALTTIGTALVASGVICFQTVPPPYNLLCLIPTAAGMAMVIAGTLRGEDALDPPVPDFGCGDEKEPGPCDWQLPASEGNPAAAAFLALTHDLRRIDAAARDAARARDRAFAAHIDGDRDRLEQQRRECREALGRLDRAVQALVPIVDEAQSRGEDERLAPWAPCLKSEKLLAGKELVAKVREHAKELKISKADLERVETVLAPTTQEQVREAVASLRAGRMRELPTLAARWFEAIRAEYAGHPFLTES